MEPTTKFPSVDGLLNVYIVDEREIRPAIYFEFEDKKKGEKVIDLIYLIAERTNTMASSHLSKEEADKSGALDVLISQLIPAGATECVYGFTAKGEGAVGTPITSAQAMLERFGKILSARAEETVTVKYITLSQLTIAN